MLQTKIIDKENCAVAFEPTEIMIRKRGRAYFGQEKTLAELRNGKLYVYPDAAKEFGIEIVCENEV